MTSICRVVTTSSSGVVSTLDWNGDGELNTKTVNLDLTGPCPKPLVPHAYNVSRHTQHINEVVMRLPGKTGSGVRYYDIKGDPSGLAAINVDNVPALLSINEGTARNKALASLQGGDVNLATFFGEGHKTLESFVNTARRLASAANEIRNKNFVTAFHTLGTEGTKSSLSRLSRMGGRNKSGLDTLANGWLEYQYGWKPLISDLYGLVQAWHKGFVTSGTTFSIRAKVTDSKPYVIAQQATYQTDGPTYFYRGSGVSTATAKAGGKLRVTNSYLATLGSLGLLNPLSLAWELLPYSFVVDWFIPVGNYLAATTSTAGMQWVNGWSSIERKRVFECQVYNGSFTETKTDYSRSVWGGLAAPTALLRIINGLSDSSSRQASAASLLQQAFSRR